ncbi:SMI1/KNR4 family protein [Baaleninema simplex]|uniref:SMI1/KNR4 family protein n=1 Tax=Baaleninema simplex TaxID=2862350 RepID=UPI00038134B5|nr:SMI1/KNR4 family protein [Baaleninema simplex]
MKFQYIKEAIDLFESRIEGDDVKIIPCTLEEIAELEVSLSPPYKLPAAYKEFLLYGGKEMAGLFYMIDFSYNMAKLLAKTHYRDVIRMLRFWEGKDNLASEIFVLNENLGSNMY